MTQPPTPLVPQNPIELKTLLQALLEEIKMIRREREFYQANNQLFAEMCYSLLGESKYRGWLARLTLQNERIAARQKIPLWFWRPELKLDIEQQISIRARWLMDEKYSTDDTWDLIIEFLRDWAKKDITEDRLIEIIGEAANASTF